MGTASYNKKTTFVLDALLLEQAKEAVKEGGYKSLNVFVQDAIYQWVKILQREKIKKEFLEASKDPLFLVDIEEINRDFEFTDQEILADGG
ncbi:MAG: hypothetical protein A3G93_06835 [Nitrospinae bacterium RIFCSPLOWO2_12_FULL_45_22]|nr:MAG: hypothetical protein A3G93_06835 [Nitrospinae bacterium RIFCSPLOWO2_12_FULL_45_22]